MFLFFKENANDKKILIKLKSRDLTTISKKFRRLRLKMKLRNKYATYNVIEQDKKIIHIIKKHLNQNVINKLSLTNLKTYFHRNEIIISKHDMMYVLRIVNFVNVNRRRERK